MEDRWHYVARAEDLQAGSSISVAVPKAGAVAVFRHSDGKLYALSDRCAHGSGQLSLGDMEDLGRCAMGTHKNGSKVGGPCVRCPRHRSKMAGGLYFSLEDGRSFVLGPTMHYDELFQACPRASHGSVPHGLPGPTIFAVKHEHGAVVQVGVFDVMERKMEDGGEHIFVSKTAVKGTETPPKLQVLRRKAFNNTKALMGCFMCQAGPGEAELFSSWSLRHVEDVSTTTKIFSFESVDHKMTTWPVPAIWHVALRRRHPVEAGMDIVRDYTPVSSREEWREGVLRLLIKLYPEGLMSAELAKLSPGDAVEIGAPQLTMTMPQLQVPGDASGGGLSPESKANPQEIPVSVWPSDLTLAIIVGGTGITPGLQLLDLVAKTPDVFRAAGTVRASLIQSTRVTDVCLQERLSEAVICAEGRVTVVCALTNGGNAETSSAPVSTPATLHVAEGRVSKDILERWAPKTDSFVHAVLCGPQGMMDASSALLQEIGYSTECIVELEA
ncbi:hypothetical protein CYMTET_15456 [Cymbomonas tetramitiformis]|uniref:cytochrome-b5 reductase n=1 Tax=Cymbomonas tetramitiformis TaxID=36881 RepID=A0AAE0L8Z4_9CHLO|nr:hypothetical protein CYMTET_15456 [Cymbomonas tetramitiformis]